ncbi:MAG: TRAP transporter small permease [Candidatus Electryonea clarkiae]|nr:TRAP transporter small permease [Candidatus Electryonea clarkiae]MDP8288155.1 TRAP transporter small permease [Candidatus Electryonea clarkiae]
MKYIIKIISIIDLVISKTAAALVTIILLSMVSFAFLQVILRNIFESGIPWMDVVLRHMVLWIGMLGGLLATRQGRQISIDLLTRIPHPRFRVILKYIGSVFTIVITFILARASYVFVAGEHDYGSTLFGDVPSWYAQVILPVGFGLICLQVLLNIILGRVKSTESHVMAIQPDEEIEINEDQENNIDEIIPGEADSSGSHVEEDKKSEIESEPSISASPTDEDKE